MKFKSQLFLFALFPLVLASCQNYSGQQESQLIAIDTLLIADFEILVSTESALLGEPMEIVSMNENHLAVYDHAYKKIFIFNSEGDKLDEFGNVGEGPGEWDAMFGVSDLNFLEDRFFTTNRGRHLFDLYDSSGTHIRSIPFHQYLNYSHKTLLPDHNLLITTNGRENALAAIMNLNEEGDIIQKIGLPESDYSERRNIEQERVAYSNGEIPENALNNALAAKGKEGVFIFMTALGELRHYSDEGELIFQKEIPNPVKESVFDFIVHQNREEVRQHTVMPLVYAREMQIHDELIYLFMPKPHPEAAGMDFRMLVYNSDGELKKHYVFADPENESFLYDFAIDSDNNIYFIDVMRAEILKFSPDIE